MSSPLPSTSTAGNTESVTASALSGGKSSWFTPIVLVLGGLLLLLLIIFLVRTFFLKKSGGKPNNPSAENNGGNRPASQNLQPPNDGLEMVNDDAVLSAVAASKGKPGAIMVYSLQCGFCKMLRTTLKQVQDEHPEFKIMAVDFRNSPKLVAKYQPNGYPLVLFHANGELKSKDLGAKPKEFIVTRIQAVAAEAAEESNSGAAPAPVAAPVPVVAPAPVPAPVPVVAPAPVPVAAPAAPVPVVAPAAPVPPVAPPGDAFRAALLVDGASPIGETPAGPVSDGAVQEPSVEPVTDGATPIV